MDKFKEIFFHKFENESNDSGDSSDSNDSIDDSSDASCKSNQSIIWIGPKLKITGSVETTEVDETSDTTRESDVQAANTSLEKTDGFETIVECDENVVPEQHDVHDDEVVDSDASESTQIPETSCSSFRSEFSETLDSDVSDNGSKSDTDSDGNHNDDIEVENEKSLTDGSEGTTGTTGTTVSKKPSKPIVRKHVPNSPMEMGQYFTDEEYESGILCVEVPKKSLFSYLKVDKTPIYLVNMPEKTELVDIVDDMLANNKGSFMRIEIGSKAFQCIPNLLKIYSPWFANQQWNVTYIEFNEKDVPAVAFKIIYKWMLDRTVVKQRNAIKVLQAAKYLQIDLLIEECWKILSKPNVREKVAFDIFLNAEESCVLADVSEIMLSRIRLYFLAMVGSEYFVKLTLQKLNFVLQLDSIGVNSEVEVFYTIIRWISHNPPERLQHMKELMEHVRFPYMSMTTLFSLRKERPDQDFNDICCADYVLIQFTNDSAMKKKIYDAVSFISLRMQSAAEQDLNDTIPKELRSPRDWLYHPKCPYHLLRVDYPYKHNITYSAFIEFITVIQDDWKDDKPLLDGVQAVAFDGYRQKDIVTGVK